WILIEPIVTDAELEKTDQAFMFAAGGIRAIAPCGTKLHQIRSGEVSQQSEATVLRPRQQVKLKESLALVRGGLRQATGGFVGAISCNRLRNRDRWCRLAC